MISHVKRRKNTLSLCSSIWQLLLSKLYRQILMVCGSCGCGCGEKRLRFSQGHPVYPYLLPLPLLTIKQTWIWIKQYKKCFYGEQQSKKTENNNKNSNTKVVLMASETIKHYNIQHRGLQITILQRYTRDIKRHTFKSLSCSASEPIRSHLRRHRHRHHHHQRQYCEKEKRMNKIIHNEKHVRLS